MHDLRHRPAHIRLLIFICVGLLLVASTVQAAHICGLGGSATRVLASGEDVSSRSGSLCPLCLLAQSVTAAIILMTTFSPLRASRFARQSQPVLFSPFLRSFRLYVRPPPVF